MSFHRSWLKSSLSVSSSKPHPFYALPWVSKKKKKKGRRRAEQPPEEEPTPVQVCGASGQRKWHQRRHWQIQNQPHTSTAAALAAAKWHATSQCWNVSYTTQAHDTLRQAYRITHCFPLCITLMDVECLVVAKDVTVKKGWMGGFLFLAAGDSPRPGPLAPGPASDTLIPDLATA